MKEPVIFIDIPTDRVQHKLFIYFFAGTIIKTPEPFVFLDVSKVPFCLDGSDDLRLFHLDRDLKI